MAALSSEKNIVITQMRFHFFLKIIKFTIIGIKIKKSGERN